MVNNLAPTNYQNVSLDQTTTTPTNDIPSYFYFIKNMTPSDVNSIINNNNNIVQATIATLSLFNNNVVYDTISNLLALQANLIELAAVLLNSFFGNIKQYKVPYDLDLLSVCLINNLDYNTQSETIYLLNQAIIPSANYIPSGTILSIPIASDKVMRTLI